MTASEVVDLLTRFNKLVSTPVLFGFYTVLSVLGMVLVKYAAPLVKLAMSTGGSVVYPGSLVLVGATMYVCSFLLWMTILVREPLMVAYPIAVGLTMLFSTICAIVLLRESLTWNMAIGGILVVAGVALLARA